MNYATSYQVKDYTLLTKEQEAECIQKFLNNEGFQNAEDLATEQYIFRFIHRHIKTTIPTKTLTHTSPLPCKTRPMINEKVFIPLIQKPLRIFDIVHYADKTVLELEPYYDRYETYISDTAKKLTKRVVEEIQKKKKTSKIA